jgi:Ca2+-binding EF-hand superfamily protein
MNIGRMNFDHMKIRNASLVAIALAFASPAFAQQAAQPAQGAAQPAAQQPGGPDAVFALWDTDKNGSLSKDEFRVGWSNVRNEMVMQRLHAEFQARDIDKSGKLESGEFSNLVAVQKLGKSAPAMTAFDANKNGGLEFPEYVEFLKAATRQAAPAAAPKN